MYCLSNICYVCLEKKSKLLSNINNSSVNKDIIHIIGYLPFNLASLKTMRNLLICEQCCLRLRETYQFLEMCLKNSALLEGYMDKLNTTAISNTDNEAELRVYLNIKPKDIDEVKREIKLQNEEIYTFQWQPNIEETEDSLVKQEIICKNELDDKQEYPTDNNSTEIIEKTKEVFGNLKDYVVKEKNTWKREEIDHTDEYSMDNNFTDNIDSEISLSDNANINNTDGVSATNKNDLNTSAQRSYKCSTCTQSFFEKSNLKLHIRMHTTEKTYECAICKKLFKYKGSLAIHMRVHTGEKPYSCTRCMRCFSAKSFLVSHARTYW